MIERFRERLLVTEVAPVSEPLTLAEAKLYLRVDGTEEDTLITSLIATVRTMAEQHLRRSLMTQQWKLAYDDYAPAETNLPMGPVQSIISVTQVAEGGGTTVAATSLYALNAAKTTLVFDQIICAHQVEIVYQAGFGDASAVPEPLRQGMLAHLAELYDGRSRALPLPGNVAALYYPYREVRL